MMKLLPITLAAFLGATSSYGAINLGVELATSRSFEAGASEEITGWFEEDADSSEVRELEASATVPVTPAGLYWLNLTTTNDNGLSAAVYQELGTWNTGNSLSYDVSAILGDRSDEVFGAVTFSLWSSDNAVFADDTFPMSGVIGAELLDSSDAFDIVENASTQTQATGTFTLDASGIADNDRLWLRISATGLDGNQSLVDDVSVIAVPEPSAYALLTGLGALAVIMLRRRLV